MWRRFEFGARGRVTTARVPACPRQPVSPTAPAAREREDAHAYTGVEETEPEVDCWELPQGLLAEYISHNNSSAVVRDLRSAIVLDRLFFWSCQ